MTQISALSFDSASKLFQWFKANHRSEDELWIRIFKKSSKVPSLTWEECVLNAIAWGWIDSQKRSLDEQSYIQRFTPRRKNSMWSKRNRDHAERLISQGKMQAAGFAQVSAAKENGRWENAYAGSSSMDIPKDFLKALGLNPLAETKFQVLNRSKQFTIYHQLQTSLNKETRNQRIADLINKIETDNL